MKFCRAGLTLLAAGLLVVASVVPAGASTSGQALGWGRNTAGQVGDATFVNRSLPVPSCAPGATDCGAFPLTSVRAVAGGGAHSLGLLENGTALAWGANFDGQLGDGSTTSRLRPGPVCAVGATDCDANPLTGVTAVAGGAEHSLALLSDGTVVAWGRNFSGRLGDGTMTDRTTPVRVCAVAATDCAANPLRGVVAISAGSLHSLAVLADGTAVAWGANFSGQLGDGTTTSRLTPVPVCASSCAGSLSGVAAVAAGSGHTLALLRTGKVLSWGFNGSGELGDGTITSHPIPAPVCARGAVDCAADPLGRVRSIAAPANGAHSLALLITGQVLSWGFNGNGELGDGTTTSRATPDRVCAITATNCARSLTNATAIAAGGQASAALIQGGTAVTWGANSDGQLGDGGAVPTRTQPGFVCSVGATDCTAQPLTNVVSISAGRWHFLAIRGS